MGRWVFLFVATLAAAAIVGSTAGARTQRFVPLRPAASPSIDLTTRAGVEHFLNQHGIKAKGVVIQRGVHNYAGPSCPGVTWTCTTAKAVVQFGPVAGVNQFQCSSSTGAGGSSSPPDGCVIVQVSSGSENDATCVEGSTLATGVSQSCVIFQTNTTGANKLSILQQVSANGGAAQAATQYAGTNQQSGSGENDAVIEQDIAQQTSDTGPGGTQSQDGHQGVSVTQLSDTGNNNATVNQSLALYATIAGNIRVVNQAQDATSGGLNTAAGITQHSTSGANVAQLNQSNALQAQAPGNSSGSQQQGTPGGGLLGHFDQLSSGLSTVNGSQTEHQVLAPGNPNGALNQSQYGPAWWGSTQFGNPNDTYNIASDSNQNGSKSAFQSDREYANCDTSGVCNADQTIHQNGNNQQNTCSNPSCHIGLIVISGGEGSGTTTCTGFPTDSLAIDAAVVTCPRPPLPPPPPPPPVTIG
jgi:hypothetical protein